MTRLTEEQIREAWDEPMMADHVPKWYQLPILWFDKNRNFAHRIAALAVQEVEREVPLETRTRWAKEFNALAAENAALRAQLATAKREAFCDGAAWELGAVGKRTARQEAERRYPATPSDEGCVRCGDTCKPWCHNATPSPEAREVPEYVDLRVSGALNALGDRTVRITPADAKRIVRLAQEEQ